MTKKTKPVKNLQHAFNLAVVGVYRQGQRCVEGQYHPMCVYRKDLPGKHVTKCAIGHMFRGKASVEAGKVKGSVYDSRISKLIQTEGWKLNTVEKSLLCDLQRMHDRCTGTSTKAEFRKTWVERAKEFARAHNLTFPTLPKVR